MNRSDELKTLIDYLKNKLPSQADIVSKMVTQTMIEGETKKLISIGNEILVYIDELEKNE